MTDFHVKAKSDFDLGLDPSVAFVKGGKYEVLSVSDVRVHVRNGEKITSFNHADLDRHFVRVEGPFVPAHPYHLKAKFAFDLGLGHVGMDIAFIRDATYEVIAEGETRVTVRNGNRLTSFNHADVEKHFERIEGPFVPKYSLEGLLEGFKPEHRHPEIDFGPPVGREIL